MPNFEFTDRPEPHAELTDLPAPEPTTVDGITAEDAVDGTRDLDDLPPDIDDMPKDSHDGEHFDAFLAENGDALREKMDGPEGFFARAQAENLIDSVDPRIAEAIDQADDAALERLGVTKEELKIISAAYGSGQQRSLLTSIKVPTRIDGVDTVVHTDAGDLPLEQSSDASEPTALPRGTFVKSRGELWMIGPRMEDRYPEAADRRLAALWSYGHEFGHGVMGDGLWRMILGEQGRNITLPDGEQTDTTTYLRQTLSQTLPEAPLTEYSGSYRTDEGRLPSEEEGPIGFIRGVEEEMCEVASASIFGFAPTPGRSPQDAIDHPFEGREDFQRRVWDYMRAAAR